MWHWGRNSATWILGLSAVLWVATAGCSDDYTSCDEPPSNTNVSFVLPGCSAGVVLTTTGGCTARCEACHPFYDADAYSFTADPRCDYVFVEPLAEGPCSIRAQVGNSPAVEAQLLVHAAQCWLLMSGDSAFVPLADAATTDSAAE
jgi:hypothetical protein